MSTLQRQEPSFQCYDPSTQRLIYHATTVIPVRHPLKVFRAVVVLDAIEVMYDPTGGERLPMRFLPDQDVLLNVAPLIGSWVIWGFPLKVEYNSCRQ